MDILTSLPKSTKPLTSPFTCTGPTSTPYQLPPHHLPLLYIEIIPRKQAPPYYSSVPVLLLLLLHLFICYTHQNQVVEVYDPKQILWIFFIMYFTLLSTIALLYRHFYQLFRIFMAYLITLSLPLILLTEGPDFFLCSQTTDLPQLPTV